MTVEIQPYNPNGQGKDEKKQASTRARGRFRKGQSGNPAGRPRGSRNEATLAAEALLEGEACELTRKAIELAKSGNLAALRLCLDRILAPRRSRPVTFDLPSTETAEDISAAYQAVLRAVAESQLTLDEAQQVVNILEAKRRAIETVDLAEDVAALKKRVGLGE